jgi:hypothetical protein
MGPAGKGATTSRHLRRFRRVRPLGLFRAAVQLFRLKVPKQPKWYALACSLSFTVTLMWLPGEKESVWLAPHGSLPAGCVMPMMTVSAVAGWTVVPRVVSLAPLIDPLDSRVPLVPP